MRKNPFKDPPLRKTYDAVIECYRTRHKDIWRPAGQPRPGNAWSNSFWRGYNRVQINWDAYSRSTPAYACYRAGEAVRAAEERGEQVQT